MAETSTKRSLQSNGQLLRNQKMRTTCNACQQAKIRCSHTYPCDRCESHGYQCVYSISQPLGRPAKRKMIRPAAAGTGIKMRRKEVEGVDRPTRLAPEERAQRARRVPSRIPSPTTSSGSGPSSREESYKSDPSTGTEVTPPKGNFQWSSFTNLLSDVAGNHKIGQGIQDHEAENRADPGFSDTSPDSSFEQNDGFESSGGPRFSGRVDYSTQCYTSHIGLMVDEPPIEGFLHTAAPDIQSGSLFQGGAIYPFSLAPNAIQVSGTVRNPARIMDLPSSEIWHEPVDTDSSQSLPLEDIDLEALPEDASSLHCNCYAQAFSEVMQSEEVNGPNKILLHLERVQQQGVVILQCQSWRLRKRHGR
ncbi:transcriptional regulator family: Fungal Specific TF [Penicillium roqueforti]|uniref:transcriptional regulator family: Fungal Specific TF n=1 Tax=Penicillium roqueforti TaxID=5082 RepID=UPI00190A4932|nr:transcriptional regulator family: Fungal Specific TF [Penicillium roqueforti]KAF9240538.1 transcriptional regulator family: Fungal Specific TF [Penicillium roqueforti]KAI1830767.1 transcriptional regulator family: Fungal Specific TF [Penicillium roqueforti]KAI2674484.1 transcriptional regulator family: Fungal Specific TF [Penicillium roqueforti]KAI2696789.1 transcriptional regulator family: Fungal Specific TF [Penicillium roqueforti]KAI2711012.1 transcriptional regulator family: Fungal Spec